MIELGKVTFTDNVLNDNHYIKLSGRKMVLFYIKKRAICCVCIPKGEHYPMIFKCNVVNWHIKITGLLDGKTRNKLGFPINKIHEYELYIAKKIFYSLF